MTLERTIGIVGWSGVGKTTLIERLVPAFVARGLRVSTVKHCHYALALDTPGKDSDRHQLAGATQTMLMSPAGTVIVERARHAPPSLAQALSAMTEVDLVLVEGFRDYDLPQLEVWDASADRPPRALKDRSIAALISDCPLPAGFDRPVFRRNDVAAVSDFVLRLLTPFALIKKGRFERAALVE